MSSEFLELSYLSELQISSFMECESEPSINSITCTLIKIRHKRYKELC